MNKATQFLNSGEAQVINIGYIGGACTPWHIATSDAYLVIEKRTALMIYRDLYSELAQISLPVFRRMNNIC
ncbi:hypothetical protein ACVWYN_002078 [Pedobacter sp. UYP24]